MRAAPDCVIDTPAERRVEFAELALIARPAETLGGTQMPARAQGCPLERFEHECDSPGNDGRVGPFSFHDQIVPRWVPGKHQPIVDPVRHPFNG